MSANVNTSADDDASQGQEQMCVFQVGASFAHVHGAIRSGSRPWASANKVSCWLMGASPRWVNRDLHPMSLPPITSPLMISN